LRRAEALWGSPPPRKLPKLAKWTPCHNESGTLLGYAEVELASGMRDLKIMRGPKGELWVALPSKKLFDAAGEPALGQNGKAVYSQIIEFRDKAAGEKFRDLILDLVRMNHAEDLL
jgi:hypothetical protein